METPDVVQATSMVTEDFMICSLCHDIYTNPKLLRCLHTFCLHCITNHITKNSEESGQFSCPTCNTPVELPTATATDEQVASCLPDDHFIAKLVELRSAIKEDKSCDVCSRRGETTEAAQWCNDCHDAMCTSCLQIHSHVKVTSGHSVMALAEMRQMPLETFMKKRTKVMCTIHGEQISLYCVDCEEPICAHCLAVAHRRCDNVITLSDAVLSHSNIEVIKSKLDMVRESMDVTEQLENLVSSFNESVKTTKHEITYLCDSLCQQIREKEQYLLKMLNDKENEARSILNERVEPRKKQTHLLKSATQRMKCLMRYGTDIEVVIAFNQIRKSVDDFNKFLSDFSWKTHQVKVEFVPSDLALSYTEEMIPLGGIKVTAHPEQEPSLWGVTCTSVDDIIVTDCKNKRIQKFSRNGNLVDHVQLDDEPRDITTCGDNDDVAVPLIGRLIVFMATRKSLTIIRRSKTERQYDGIAYSKSARYLIATSLKEQCVDTLHLDGEVLRSIKYTTGGDLLFEQPRYVTASIKGTFVVSDIGNNTVQSFDENGHPLFKYCSEEDLKSPQGVCVDKVGNVFVADFATDSIQLLTSQGAFQRYALAKDSGIERPCAVVLSTTNKLTIVQSDGMVKVFTYC